MRSSPLCARLYNKETEGASFKALSLYEDEAFNAKDCFKELATLTELFSLSKEYICILVEALKENKFTNERFKDSVRHIVGTFKYKSPNIADFLEFDDFVRLYPWDVKNKLVWGGVPLDDFFLVGCVGGLAHYIRLSEVLPLSEQKKMIVRRLVRELRENQKKDV